MTTVILQAELEHAQGPFTSAAALGEELVSMLDGESIDVDDSEYTVSSVETIEFPAKRSKTDADGLGKALWVLLDNYAHARPIIIDGVDPVRSKLSDQEKALDAAISNLVFRPDVGKMVTTAKAKAARAKAKSRV